MIGRKGECRNGVEDQDSGAPRRSFDACAAAAHLLPLSACPRNVLISEHKNGHNLTSTKHFFKIQKAFFIACQDLTNDTGFSILKQKKTIFGFPISTVD